MKKRIQKYLSGEREGFSLVELIIVIAIMAILIAVIALAVLPYLERSRESKDKQTLDTVYGAFQTALAEEKVATECATGFTKSDLSGKTTTIAQIEKNLGAKISDAEGKLVSTNAKNNHFAFTYKAPTATDPSGEITVSIVDGSGNVVKDGDNNDFTSSSKKATSGS